VKILIDENLSQKLALHLADLFSHLHHARNLGLRGKSDTELWTFAHRNGYEAILTADADFQNKALELGPPPKVIRIERCDFSTRDIADLVRREAIRITDFMGSPAPLLVLRR
jgi:predicted nuclease of predicted toxin-antitoxin system